MPELPTGTVTFLFTDIEGSTRLLQASGREGYRRLQDMHSNILRSAMAEHGGAEIRTEGDSFFVVFQSATAALRAAVAAQRGLAANAWAEEGVIRVRIGLHTGEGVRGGDDYVGIDVNRAARIAATGHGGQIVLSETTRSLVAGELPEGVAIRDLGSHRLKDIEQAEHLHDLVIDGLPADFPALRTLDMRRTNLPAQRSSFIGRAAEIADVDALLDEARLVTLTGPGGTGKTRLALEIAAHRLDRHDGVYVVDLSNISDPAYIVPAIAGVLRVRESPDVELADSLRNHLRERSLLLVLDNLEQLARDCSIVGELLDDAPGLTVLATSRTALHLTGEREVQVPPLALPDPSERDIERLSMCESVRLFAERAVASRRSFAVTHDNAPAVAEIVSRLDGLPLALELAASRLSVLDPAGLAGRLGHRLPLLTGGARDAPERQRTLEETIRWSEEALSDGDRHLFARLSVFAGGCTMEAAESVCGGDLDVLDGLGRLVDNSLVRRLDLPDGSVRFAMLETIREYAAARFAEADAAERDDIERRHAAFVLDLTERAEEHLTGEQQIPWFSTLDFELENVRAALDRAERSTNSDDVGMGLRTAAALWRFWQRRGHLTEGRSRLSRLLSLPGAERRDAARAVALGALGSIDYWLMDYDSMQASYEEAVSIAEELGDRRLLSRALFNLSFVGAVAGQTETTVPTLERALKVADPSDLAIQAQIWTALGYGRVFFGDLPAAIERLERALDLHRQAGEQLGRCETLFTLAGIYLLLEDRKEMHRYLNEATEIASASGNPLLITSVLYAHAMLAIRSGRPEHAARLAGASDRLEQDYELHFPEVATAFFGDPGREAHEALGDEAFEQAREEGFVLDTQGIIELIEGGRLEITP